MKHWEEYFYELDKSYTEDELKQIKALLRQTNITAAIFTPIVTFLTMGAISLSILSIIFDNKMLNTSTLIVLLVFLFTCGLWFFFQYRNSLKRIKLMKTIKHNYKKPC